MGLTVAELIKELKKYPKDSLVGYRDHDAREDEIGAHILTVSEFDPENSFDPEYCKGVKVVLG